MEKKNIKIKDIMQSLRLLPQTLSLLNKIEKKLFVKVVIVSLLTGIFPIVTLLFSQELLNSLVVDGKLKYTFFIFISYIMVSFLAFLVEEADEYVKTLYQYKLQFKLQYMLMQRCTRLSLRDFESAATYDRVEKISSGISYQPFQIFLAVTSIITAIVTMLSSVVIILLWKPVMALILLLVPILSLFYYLKIGQQEFDMMYNRAKEERKLWYFNHLLTHDFSYKEVKLLGIGEYILNKYREISLNFIKQNKRLLNKKTIFNILYGIIVQIIGFIIIGAAIVSAFLGRILVGNVISIIRAIGMIQSNSRVLMSNIYSIYSGSLYMEMLFRFLKEHEEEPLLEKGKTEINDFSDIRMENVCFSYDNKKETIKNVSLHISKGERVAIVGPNGSGKSTLLKILTGLYEPSEGEVFINQKSIKDIDMKGYYSKISVLFQDFMKYEFTLRENVGFGNIEKINDDDEMINVLKEMKIDFLKSSEDQYCLDMQLGNWFENGRELSQGQWQKIALARTCFKNAQCYILDEPNAALDTVSEREVFNRFFEISKDKIGIYISHRLSAAKMADKIIVMNEGEIAAIGQHEDLLNRSKIYQELFQAENYEMEISEYAK